MILLESFVTIKFTLKRLALVVDLRLVIVAKFLSFLRVEAFT